MLQIYILIHMLHIKRPDLTIFLANHPKCLKIAKSYDQKVGMQKHTFAPPGLIVGVCLLRLLHCSGAYVPQSVRSTTIRTLIIFCAEQPVRQIIEIQ